jgi:DNA-binding phage protein
MIKSGAGEDSVNEVTVAMAASRKIKCFGNIVEIAKKNPMAERILYVFEGTAHPSFRTVKAPVKSTKVLFSQKDLTENSQK